MTALDRTQALTVQVEVSKYRDGIDGLVEAVQSMVSAASDKERAKEAIHVANAANELITLCCPRARQHDLERKMYWLGRASDLLETV